MQVDFSVELGHEDPTLEIPWASSDGMTRYQNLKGNPAALDQVPEAASYPELREFLVEINAPDSKLESAKCDVWSTTEIHPEEEIFGEPWKFGCYMDLLFTDPELRESFSHHEQFLKTLCASLKSKPDISASAEFILRRCFTQKHEKPREGFYFTVYVFGYGRDESQARKCWSTALANVRYALLNDLRAPHLPQ